MKRLLIKKISILKKISRFIILRKSLKRKKTFIKKSLINNIIIKLEREIKKYEIYIKRLKDIKTRYKLIINTRNKDFYNINLILLFFENGEIII